MNEVQFQNYQRKSILKYLISFKIENSDEEDESSDESSSEGEEDEAELDELRTNVRNALGDAACPDSVCFLSCHVILKLI